MAMYQVNTQRLKQAGQPRQVSKQEKIVNGNSVGFNAILSSHGIEVNLIVRPLNNAANQRFITPTCRHLPGEIENNVFRAIHATAIKQMKYSFLVLSHTYCRL